MDFYPEGVPAPAKKPNVDYIPAEEPEVVIENAPFSDGVEDTGQAADKPQPEQKYEKQVKRGKGK
ncbi:MAG: hypothetical protein ACOY4I_04730 [Bacillota bacterium]